MPRRTTKSPKSRREISRLQFSRIAVATISTLESPSMGTASQLQCFKLLAVVKMTSNVVMLLLLSLRGNVGINIRGWQTETCLLVVLMLGEKKEKKKKKDPTHLVRLCLSITMANK